MASQNQSTGGRVAWSSMKQSWGSGLLILGAVVLTEGELSVLSGAEVVWWGFMGHPLSEQPLKRGVCEGTVCLWRCNCV